jgi:uncharacterized protein (DUF3084 family)
VARLQRELDVINEDSRSCSAAYAELRIERDAALEELATVRAELEDLRKLYNEELGEDPPLTQTGAE